jgi:hypothetical protein
MTTIECKRCHCEEVRRVWRQGPIERWIYPLMSIYPFVCGRCGLRFTTVLPDREEEQIPAYPAVSNVTHL